MHTSVCTLTGYVCYFKNSPLNHDTLMTSLHFWGSNRCSGLGILFLSIRPRNPLYIAALPHSSSHSRALHLSPVVAYMNISKSYGEAFFVPRHIADNVLAQHIFLPDPTNKNIPVYFAI